MRAIPPLANHLPKSKACDGKIGFPILRDAEGTLKKMKRKTGRETLNIYQCPYCGKYHLGNIIKI